MWTVDEPYNSTGGVRFDGDSNATSNGTLFNETYMEAGDSTIFVITQESDLNSSWPEEGLPFWTSPHYILGSNPLPASAGMQQTT